MFVIKELIKIFVQKKKELVKNSGFVCVCVCVRERERGRTDLRVRERGSRERGRAET